MSSLLFQLLLASIVAAQANHVIHGFEYYGCVNITSDQFGAVVNFPAGFTPEQCESACTGFDYAAAFPDGCRCGRNIASLPKVAESICSNPCGGNTFLGFCGFNDATCSYANVYRACDDFPSDPNAPAPSSPGSPYPPGSNPPGASPPGSNTLFSYPPVSYLSTLVNPSTPATTYLTVRLPTVTRTFKLATKSTQVVVHTVPPGGLSTSCAWEHDHTPAPSLPPFQGVPTGPIVIVQTVYVHKPAESSSGLEGYDTVQGDPPAGTLQGVPPAATQPTATTETSTLWPSQGQSTVTIAYPPQTAATESTLWPPQGQSTVTVVFPPQTAATETTLWPPQGQPTTLVPYADPADPIASAPGNVGNATISASREVPEFRTILPDDPPASATQIVPAVVTTAQAHRVNAGMAGAIAMAFMAVGI
ncbi:twinfilin-1 [Colletotrichum kahawae]|uniref:Twinfilin-1 n=1 Tax=Colletotrichum kahawae TaxID=34407 RepID=A0AAE0D737_COLKA|nr:twinfilin-1 [Colletotrichum kahawae]